jgi:peptidoglycan/LPS O-acetylase OafA/YrhL
MNNQLRETAAASSRLAYVDNLRVALVILVVLHHVAVVYGAAAPFYYVEPPYTDARAFQVLLVFVLANQSFFMGALFLLAGYFVPSSYQRKGAGGFLKEKLIRLGIPLVIWIFVLNPVSSIGYYLMPATVTGITTPLTWQAYPELIGLGPLWFVAMLLVFSLGYVGWRAVTRNRVDSRTDKRSRFSFIGIGIVMLALAGATYLFRMLVPMGRSVWGFPTLSYLPQYLSLFVLGIVSNRRNWFESMPGSRGIAGAALALVVLVLLFPLAFDGRWFSLTVGPALNNAMGGGHWQSAVYALFDSVFAVGMCLGLITLFRRFFNGEGSLASLLSRNSYAVYIIHTPVLIYLAYAMRAMDLPGLLKFGVVSIITVLVCFAVAHALRKIPGVSRVI